MFGHPAVHDDAGLKQFAGYATRYGPGLVLYWMGFLEGLACPPEARAPGPLLRGRGGAAGWCGVARLRGLEARRDRNFAARRSSSWTISPRMTRFSASGAGPLQPWWREDGAKKQTPRATTHPTSGWSSHFSRRCSAPLLEAPLLLEAARGFERHLLLLMMMAQQKSGPADAAGFFFCRLLPRHLYYYGCSSSVVVCPSHSRHCYRPRTLLVLLDLTTSVLKNHSSAARLQRPPREQSCIAHQSSSAIRR